MLADVFFRAYANLRQSSLDGMTGRGGGGGHHAVKPRSSSSETNLRKLTMGDAFGGVVSARPGSALGLLQGRTRGEDISRSGICRQGNQSHM